MYYLEGGHIAPLICLDIEVCPSDECQAYTHESKSENKIVYDLKGDRSLYIGHCPHLWNPPLQPINHSQQSYSLGHKYNELVFQCCVWQSMPLLCRLNWLQWRCGQYGSSMIAFVWLLEFNLVAKTIKNHHNAFLWSLRKAILKVASRKIGRIFFPILCTGQSEKHQF